jgi:hypothetical protein
MDFKWDILHEDGVCTVVKQFHKLEGVCCSKKTAKQAAAIDAQLIHDISRTHGKFIVKIDLQGVKMRRSVYTFIKEGIRLQAPRPDHTYIVNAPAWGTKVYAVVSKWLSEEDRTSVTVC